MIRFKIFLIVFLFFSKIFTVKCNPIKIIDNEDPNNIYKYFNTYSGDCRNTDFILVKMNNSSISDDIENTFMCNKKFTNNGINYELIIIVEKNNKLTYCIKHNDNTPLTDNEKKLFYKDKKKDPITKNETIDTSSRSFLNSKNWVLVKVKPVDGDEFYAFINDISLHFTGKSNYSLFGYFGKIKELKFIYSEFSENLNIAGLFSSGDGGNTAYEYIDLTGFQIKNNLNLAFLFYKCKNIKKIKLPKCTAKDIYVSHMFYDCVNLEEIDFTGFNIKTYIPDLMFCNCKKMKKINLGDFKSQLADITNMFYGVNLDVLIGIENLLKDGEKDENGNEKIYDINSSFRNSKINNLDLQKISAKIGNINCCFSNSEIENLKLFNMKQIIEYYKRKEPNKKPKMFKNSKIKNLIIRQDYLPDSKEDLATFFGDGYEIGKIEITDKNGNVIKTYNNVNDFRKDFDNNYKEEKENNERDKINTENIKNINGDHCSICCLKCFSNCCCCCKTKT